MRKYGIFLFLRTSIIYDRDHVTDLLCLNVSQICQSLIVLK